MKSLENLFGLNDIFEETKITNDISKESNLDVSKETEITNDISKESNLDVSKETEINISKETEITNEDIFDVNDIGVSKGTIQLSDCELNIKNHKQCIEIRLSDKKNKNLYIKSKNDLEKILQKAWECKVKAVKIPSPITLYIDTNDDLDFENTTWETGALVVDSCKKISNWVVRPCNHINFNSENKIELDNVGLTMWKNVYLNTYFHSNIPFFEFFNGDPKVRKPQILIYPTKSNEEWFEDHNITISSYTGSLARYLNIENDLKRRFPKFKGTIFVTTPQGSRIKFDYK